MSERAQLSAALALPLDERGRPDLTRLSDHAEWCLANGCDGVALFGTTGEGASLGQDQRERVLGALIGRGIKPSQSIIAGICASAPEEAAVQIRSALDAGCAGVLLPPPFYFKSILDRGLLEWFASVFEASGTAIRDVILYNIPSVTTVALSPALIGRLREAFPNVVTGIKDSSGDIASARAYLTQHADLAVLVGDERLLARSMRAGAKGSISGLANVFPAEMRVILETAEENDQLSCIVDEVLRHPVVPALKALLAHRFDAPAWRRTLPPLEPLGPDQTAKLVAAVEELVTTNNPAAKLAKPTC